MSIATGPWRLYNVPTGCQPKQPSHTPKGACTFGPYKDTSSHWVSPTNPLLVIGRSNGPFGQYLHKLIFLISEIPIQPYQAEISIFTNVSKPKQLAPYQLPGVNGSFFGPPSLGPVLAELPGVNHNGQHHSGLLYQQVGGHTSSCCCSICLSNSIWLQTQDIVLQARHIPGCYSVIADRLSWLHQPANTGWPLHRVLDLVFKSVGSPTVKMFATVQNYPSPCLLSQTTVLWQ